MSESTRKLKRQARTVTANLGRRRKYLRKLMSARRAFRRSVLSDLFSYIESLGVLAEDDSLSRPRPGTPEAAKLRRIKRRIEAAIRADPERFKSNLDSFIARNLPKWVELSDREARKVADWYVRNCAYDVTASQRKSFMAAGIAEEVFRDRWQMPTVGHYLSAGAREALPGLVEQNVNLITKMSIDDLTRVREAVMATVSGEGTSETLFRTLMATEGFDEARAERVVLDQTNKLSETVQRENAKALDVFEAVWIHEPGKYTSRKEHMEMDGRAFDIREGCYDRVQKRKVHPGELPYCRCQYRFIIPKKYMGIPD